MAMPPTRAGEFVLENPVYTEESWMILRNREGRA
jgi:hypothetical protein